MFYRFVRFLVKVFVVIRYRFTVCGSENEPLTGNLIVAANHHSLWDPIFVAIAIRRNLRFMAKMELFRYPVMRQIMFWLGAFPVNRGKGDSRAIKSALAILKNGEILAMFPEGTRVKAGEAKEAQNGIALLAAKTGARVLPVRVARNGRQVEVRIGEPVEFALPLNQLKPEKEDLHNFSQLIMGTIRNL